MLWGGGALIDHRPGGEGGGGTTVAQIPLNSRKCAGPVCKVGLPDELKDEIKMHSVEDSVLRN